MERRIAGRTHRFRDSRNVKRINQAGVRLTDDELDAVRDIARRLGLSQGELFRRAFRRLQRELAAAGGGEGGE